MSRKITEVVYKDDTPYTVKGKCSPTVMRATIEIARSLARQGIDYVAIPILNEEDKGDLIALLQSRLTKIEVAKQKQG